MYIKFPDGTEIRKAIANDRRYWARAYKRKEQYICPDTKLTLNTKVCYSCMFCTRIKGHDVLCRLAGGWIRYK